MSKTEKIERRKRLLDNLGNRKEDSLTPLKTFLIITEGTETEVNYFRSFPLYKKPEIRTVVVGTGANTLSLVERAKEIIQTYKSKGENFDEKWVVFDKDSFPDHHFDNAIKSAEASNIKVAFSNECFELWYLLHYRDVQASFTRQQYFKELSKNIEGEYKKNAANMYQLLLPKQSIAIKRAEALKKYWLGESLNHSKNPLTLVVNLVVELNKNTKNRHQV